MTDPTIPIETARYYVDIYLAAAASQVLDERLFATIEKQQEYFAHKFADAKVRLCDTLIGFLAVLRLYAGLPEHAGPIKEQLDLRIQEVEAELTKLLQDVPKPQKE